MKRKTKLQCAAMVLALLVFLTSSVCAYHFRGYFSRNVGYGNFAADSDYLYKIETHRDWVIQVTRNKDYATMKYELVNSKNQTRGLGITSQYTFGPTQCSSDPAQAGYEYKLRVTKMSSNPFKAYPIEADWDTDAN